MKTKLSIACSLFVVGGVASLLAAGCGSDDTQSAAAPDSGQNNNTGGGSGSGGTGPGGGANGGAPNDGGSPTESLFGDRCFEDTECPTGMFCLKQDGTQFLGGGPLGGICTVDCATDGQAQCEAVGPGSQCVQLAGFDTEFDPSDDVAFCFELCNSAQEFEDKCHGRPEMACFSTSSGASFCQPTCTGDSDCPGDRVCNLGNGICVDPVDRPGTLPIGAVCDENDDQCAGFCVAPGDETIGTCTGLCRLGSVGCGVDSSNLSDPLDAFCLFGPADAELGDLGVCGQLCNCDSDCLEPGTICSAFGATSGIRTLTLRDGFCTTPDTDGGGGGIPTCPAPGDSGTTTPVDSGPAVDSGTP